MSRHIKREKASLPVDVRGSKTSLLKVPNEATERVKLDKSIGNKLVLVLCPVTEMAGHWMRHEDLSMSNLVLDEPLNRTRTLPKQTGLGT